MENVLEINTNEAAVPKNPTQSAQPFQSWLVTGASTPYKRWSKCTMKKIGGRFLQELRGVHKLFMHFPLSFIYVVIDQIIGLG